VTAPAVLVLTLTPDELSTLVRNAVDAAFTVRAPAPTTTPLVDRREVARVLRVSSATIGRMMAEPDPLPHVFAGASPRYDLAAVRAWLDARGPKPTKAAPSKRETIPGVRWLSRGAK
jgi:hypothetical protein